MIGGIDTSVIISRLWLLYLFKTYYDAGIIDFIRLFDDYSIDEDSFYGFVWEALEYAAPIAELMPVLDENGDEVDDTEEYHWRFSSDEMKRCYRIARLIHKIEGGNTESNPRIEQMNREIEALRYFDSYSFDYSIQNEKKDAYIEVAWDCYFTLELPLCVWIVKAMEAYKTFKAELETELTGLLRKRGNRFLATGSQESMIRSAA